MHQKAIKIKTDLLGAFDYEVGLSIGHLASLYNYQMKKYRDAEKLYLRSIDISKCKLLNLFVGVFLTNHNLIVRPASVRSLVLGAGVRLLGSLPRLRNAARL